MKEAERGYRLSVDQASNQAGISLWRDGLLIAHTVLTSNSPRDTLGQRLAAQVIQLNSFLQANVPADDQIQSVVFEAVKSKIVLIVVGAYCVVPQLVNCRITEKHSFVHPSSWKAYAAVHGATGPRADIKGVKALREIGFDVEGHGIESDDTADSVLIHLTWLSKQK